MGPVTTVIQSFATRYRVRPHWNTASFVRVRGLISGVRALSQPPPSVRRLPCTMTTGPFASLSRLYTDRCRVIVCAGSVAASRNARALLRRMRCAIYHRLCRQRPSSNVGHFHRCSLSPVIEYVVFYYRLLLRIVVSSNVNNRI